MYPLVGFSAPQPQLNLRAQLSVTSTTLVWVDSKGSKKGAAGLCLQLPVCMFSVFYENNFLPTKGTASVFICINKEWVLHITQRQHSHTDFPSRKPLIWQFWTICCYWDPFSLARMHEPVSSTSNWALLLSSWVLVCLGQKDVTQIWIRVYISEDI